MKRFIAFVLTLFCCSFLFSASLKNYVGIVRPNLSEKTVTFLSDYKDYLISKGYKNYASSVEGFLSGTSFGSGFIYYASDNKPYIVTNRHVVTEAETVNFQLENDDGSVTEYKDLEIIACDEQIDIALVALPKDFSLPGLVLYEKEVEDGDDVWSAGFPGLGADPVWQLGKGNVTNAKARIKDLLDPSISTLIQHSAQVDAGNSGGPLMVVNPNTKSGYSVIGINTWKAVYRENTNYAIPASIINSFVEKTITKENETTIEQRIEQFKDTIQADEVSFDDITMYVSNDMVAVCGKDLFIKVLQKASTSVRSSIVDAFSYDPIEGLRFTLAYYIYCEFLDGEKVADFTTDAPELSGSKYNVSFNILDNKIDSVWIIEQGNWKLKDFDNLASGNTDETSTQKKNTKNDYGEKVVSIEDPYDVKIAGGFSFPKDNYDGGWMAEFGYGYEVFYIDFFAMKEDILLNLTDDFNNNKGLEKTSMTSFGFGVRLQIPINFTYVILEPYIDGKVGFSNFFGFSDNKFRWYTGYGFGADLILNCISDEWAPYAGVKYIHSSYKTNKSNRYAVMVGIKFDLL